MAPCRFSRRIETHGSVSQSGIHGKKSLGDVGSRKPKLASPNGSGSPVLYWRDNKLTTKSDTNVVTTYPFTQVNKNVRLGTTESRAFL